MLVLIPKEGEKYHSICLVEVVCKVVIVIINCRFTASISFHDFFHGLWAGCGTGIASPEAKLLQQLTSMRTEILYAIFMDLHKAYDALDRERYLEILEGYGVGPWSRLIICSYWDRIWIVYCMGDNAGYISKFFGR